MSRVFGRHPGWLPNCRAASRNWKLGEFLSFRSQFQKCKFRMVASKSKGTARRRRSLQKVAASSFILVAAFFIKLTDGLSFEAIQIPSLVQRGTNFWLSCQFQLGPDQQLYSVKWYKNNEEFYRLLVSGPQSNNQPLASNDLSAGETASKQQQQQQYFSQSGVNVLMSSSNATHVRLLNASIESEGFYACEISTQNLSSIRYEREIRVYVLPHSRLSVIGFKARYSLGDRLDLACTSDYSRPRPALAWFINNQLIQPETSSSSWFALESQNRSKLNEPTLFRQTLSLKFKLSPELLRWLWLDNSNSNQGNQSLGASGETHHQQQQQLQQQLRLRLQCKYKLTEVSDLTFNELLAHQKSSLSANVASEAGRKLLGSRQVTDVAAAAAVVSVSKLPDNRLTQSKCPAKLAELRDGLILFPNWRRSEEGACRRLGQLALQPDDPLIVEAEQQSAPSFLSEVANPDEDDDDHDEDDHGDKATGDDTQSSRRSRRQVIGLEVSPGDVISVNCSTISSLAADEAGARNEAAICSDSEARRRSLISGKYQTHSESQEAAAAAVSNQRWTRPTGRNRIQQLQQTGNKLVGQLMLTHKQLELLATSQQLAAKHEIRDESWSPPRQDESTLFAGSSSSNNNDRQLEAPPLLEWFINNQELRAQPSEGDTKLAEEEPIDYVSYFANFDSKPIPQQLPLRLNLTKRHFMTQDSALRLRCSSTQAQVLLTESVALTIWPALMDQQGDTGQQVWQQRVSANDKHTRKLLKPSTLDRSKLVADNSGTSVHSTSQYLALSLLALLFVINWNILNKNTVILLMI